MGNSHTTTARARLAVSGGIAWEASDCGNW